MRTAYEAISQDRWGGKQPIPQRESHRQMPGRLRTLRICSHLELNKTLTTDVRTVHTINESLALTTQHTTRQTPQASQLLSWPGVAPFYKDQCLSCPACVIRGHHMTRETSTHYNLPPTFYQCPNDKHCNFRGNPKGVRGRVHSLDSSSSCTRVSSSDQSCISHTGPAHPS